MYFCNEGVGKLQIPQIPCKKKNTLLLRHSKFMQTKFVIGFKSMLFGVK